MQQKPCVGVLGGMGPMSTVYYYELLTRYTPAGCDQEHLDVLISSHAATPDRTAYILGEIQADPCPVMLADAQKLVTAGATLLTITCNTAHYFYDRLQSQLPIPILHMLRCAVQDAKAAGCTRLGILATTGTMRTGIYQAVCDAEGIECVLPSPEDQEGLMEIIYGQIKNGREPDLAHFNRIADTLRAQGCQKAVLGCTELALINRDYHLDGFFIDTIDSLARHTVRACGLTPRVL